MATTGMPTLLARLTCACTSGVEFCRLKTYTSSWWVLIWLSHVALSAAVGSPPSLMAVRNGGGVMRSRSSASASGEKTLSEAPTLAPRCLASISAISAL